MRVRDLLLIIAVLIFMGGVAIGGFFLKGKMTNRQIDKRLQHHGLIK